MMTSFPILITWFPVALVALAGAQTQQFVKSLTDSRGYDKYKAPSFDTVIHSGLHLNAIIDLNDRKQEIKLDVYLRMFWFDHRLRFNPNQHNGPVVLPDDLAGRIWQPDLYFEDARRVEMEDDPVDQRLIKFYSTGRVWSATRYRVTLGCAMELARFPFDVQQCRITLQDYTHTSAERRLVWFDSNDTDPFTLSPGVTGTPQFLLTNSYIGECQDEEFGIHPCVSVILELSRSSGYSLRQYYLPMILLLVANYFSFLLGRNIPYIRFGYLLIVLILMCTTALSCSFTMALPQVSYFTLYDYWMAASFSLYFLSVLHFALVTMVINRRSSVPSYPCKKKSKKLLTEEEDEDVESRSEGGASVQATPISKSNARLARHLDLAAIIIYPVILLMFFIVYWNYALRAK